MTISGVLDHTFDGDVDVRRVFPYQATKSFISTRVTETLGLLYADHFPHRQYATARGVRHTPFYEQLKEHGACFGETAGWERAHWFQLNSFEAFPAFAAVC